MQNLEVSNAVVHIYIYIYIYVIRWLKVKFRCVGMWSSDGRHFYVCTFGHLCTKFRLVQYSTRTGIFLT